MKSSASKHSVLWPTLIGGAAGYFILHPYVMVVYRFYEIPQTTIPGLVRAAVHSFNGGMLLMGIPFILLGGTAGLLFGLWQENRRKRAEAEKLLANLERQLSNLKRP